MIRAAMAEPPRDAETEGAPDEGLEVLVVDDDKAIRFGISALLRKRGHAVRVAASAAEARRAIEERAPELALIDLALGDGSGIDVLRTLREAAPRAIGVVVSGSGSIQAAIEAMRLGAFDYVEKPAGPERLLPVIDRVRQRLRPARGSSDLRSELAELGQSPLIGTSAAMDAVLRAIEQVVQAKNTTVLILGESGTGKELVARAVHYGSPRRNARFDAFSCAALSESLVEAELFGYEKGAFTGAALAGKAGLFEAAHQGTIFLDEVGELPAGMQAKLLRVLQERVVKRVGGVDDIPIDVRVVASTNRDLDAEVAAGRFRLDLLYRLKVMPIAMPPLRERATDIPPIARYFLTEFAREFGKDLRDFAPDAMDALVAYPYPGNVRELRNVVEHAAIVAPGPSIERGHLMLAAVGGPGPEPEPAAAGSTPGLTLRLPDARLDTAMRELVLHVLRATGGNRARAAERLGISRSTLYEKLREYGVPARGSAAPET